MEISRKDFFKKSFLSVGEAVCNAAGLWRATSDVMPVLPDEDAFVPNNDETMIAMACNDHCLALNCGCIACVERCGIGAIVVIPGKGVTIDEQVCTGCGACQYVCPATPKAIIMRKR